MTEINDTKENWIVNCEDVPESLIGLTLDEARQAVMDNVCISLDEGEEE